VSELTWAFSSPRFAHWGSVDYSGSQRWASLSVNAILLTTTCWQVSLMWSRINCDWGRRSRCLSKLSPSHAKEKSLSCWLGLRLAHLFLNITLFCDNNQHKVRVKWSQWYFADESLEVVRPLPVVWAYRDVAC